VSPVSSMSPSYRIKLLTTLSITPIWMVNSHRHKITYTWVQTYTLSLYILTL
jgi:hypothetical protein